MLYTPLHFRKCITFFDDVIYNGDKEIRYV